MGFQGGWGWEKRLPRNMGGSGMVVLGIFAFLFGVPMLLLIFAGVYDISLWVYQFISGLFHSG